MPCSVFYVLYTRKFRPDAAFAYGARRFSLAVSEYARNAPKIWWGTDVEDFDVRKGYIASI